jgi:DNA mismatch endonuclease (patch repair protein)
MAELRQPRPQRAQTTRANARTPRPETASRSYAASAGVRSRMQLQKTRDTVPELAVRRAVHALGLRYRVDYPPLPGLRRRADLVFMSARVAVFIDGCFWHGCVEHGNPRPATNGWYWPDKIAKNRARDQDTDQRLVSDGWIVVRAWEHQNATEVAHHIAATVRRRQAAQRSGRIIRS